MSGKKGKWTMEVKGQIERPHNLALTTEQLEMVVVGLHSVAQALAKPSPCGELNVFRRKFTAYAVFAQQIDALLSPSTTTYTAEWKGEPTP